MMLMDKQNLRQLFKYLGVGGSTVLLYLGLVFVTVQLLHLGHFWAISISYVCAISFHFFANKIFTFDSRNANVIRELMRYLIVAFANYLITLAVVFVVVDWGRQSTYLGALLAIIVTIGLGYGMTKFWVFHHDRGPL
ncbi:GtrA family protein [Rhizobium sp. 2YAF20]|uniref:GtrA family protein n=1 Tax=Rhizobium sp. 2YAF20 TaxID=3233027 RepID=UPI003F9438B3